MVGGDSRNADAVLGQGVAKEGPLNPMGSSYALQLNNLHIKLSSMLNTKLSKEQSKELDRLEQGRAMHGERQERCVRHRCKVIALWNGKCC